MAENMGDTSINITREGMWAYVFQISKKMNGKSRQSRLSGCLQSLASYGCLFAACCQLPCCQISSMTTEAQSNRIMKKEEKLIRPVRLQKGDGGPGP